MLEPVASELIFGIVGPIGADRNQVNRLLSDALTQFGYSTQRVRLSQTIERIAELDLSGASEGDRLGKLMDAGNSLRRDSGSHGILGMLAAQAIRKEHEETGWGARERRLAFVVDSIKHPQEVHALRQIYRGGFYLLALQVDYDRRLRYLMEQKGVRQTEAELLLKRDESEELGHGQSTRDAFQLADFFLHYSGHEDKLRNSISRVVRLLFGHPGTTPTFNEFAMYLATASSMRSGDLSRQVGAVLARDHRILSTGANEVPMYGGGQYWPEYCRSTNDVVDYENGRDFARGYDSNHRFKERILDEMVEAVKGDEATKEALRKTPFREITEYGRPVHAEMEALMACARSNESTLGSDLYSTTFPCHNCAKHSIAAGINRIYYIEPYPKSRALELHDDALSMSTEDLGKRTVLRPFVGVGPRQFVNCFSMALGAGRPLARKDRATGEVIAWDPRRAVPRIPMTPLSYRELEESAAVEAARTLEKMRGNLDADDSE